MVKKSIYGLISLLLFFFISPFYLAQTIWARYVLNTPHLSPPSIVWEVYAQTLSTIDEALRIFMPTADTFEEQIKQLNQEQTDRIEEQANVILEPSGNEQFYFYAGKKDGEIIAYAGADSVAGKWGAINYMVLLSPQGEILDVMVLEYSEKRGRPVAKRRFLKQFFKKTKENDLKLMKDIKGVTGASISSRGMTNGIRKMVHVFNELYLSEGM